VVDYLDSDLAGGGLIEGAAGRAEKARPGMLVDLGAEGTLQFVVRLIAAGEVGVANEDTLAAVICVDEPSGDAVVKVGPNKGARLALEDPDCPWTSFRGASQHGSPGADCYLIGSPTSNYC
jgi:hypothetical protein